MSIKPRPKPRPKPQKSIISDDALADGIRAAFEAGIESVHPFRGTDDKIILTYNHSGGRALRIDNGTDPSDLLLDAFGDTEALKQRITDNKRAWHDELVALGAKRKRIGLRK